MDGHGGESPRVGASRGQASDRASVRAQVHHAQVWLLTPLAALAGSTGVRPGCHSPLCVGVTLRDGHGTATRRFTTHSHERGLAGCVLSGPVTS